MRFELLLLVLSMAFISIQEDVLCEGKFMPFEGTTQEEMVDNIKIVMADQTKCLDSCKADDGWKMSKSANNMNMCIKSFAAMASSNNSDDGCKNDYKYLVDDPCPYGYAVVDDKLIIDSVAFMAVMFGETTPTCAYSCDCDAGYKWAAVRECTDTSQTRKFCTKKTDDTVKEKEEVDGSGCTSKVEREDACQATYITKAKTEAEENKKAESSATELLLSLPLMLILMSLYL